LVVTAGDLTLQRSPQTGFVVGTQLGGISDAWEYNSFGELATYSVLSSGSSLYDVQYSYDKAGRIVQKTEIVDGATTLYAYSYDTAGRLYEVRNKKDDALISQYTYDTNGNRLNYYDGISTLTGIYDAQDRLLKYGNADYTYTANGELLSKTISEQTTTYQYDVLGNLLSVALPGGPTIQYVVDGMNRRVGKRVNGTPVKGFLYRNQLNPVAELDGANNIVSRFVYASRVNVPDYMIKSDGTYRIISDHQGSPRIVINTQTGEIVQRMDFDEFGRVILDTNPGFQPFGFAGGVYDPDTGLTRFGARDYDAEIGRWTAKDPIIFFGRQVNLYSYVLNNPVNISDPLGLSGIFGAVSTQLGGNSVSSILSSDSGIQSQLLNVEIQLILLDYNSPQVSFSPLQTPQKPQIPFSPDLQISVLQAFPSLTFCNYGGGGLGSISGGSGGAIPNIPEGAGGVLPGMDSLFPITGPPLEGNLPSILGPTPVEVIGNMK